MAFNHMAFATKDIEATHVFYTEVMGFRLAKVVAAPTDNPGGWARHVFYDTGDGELLAFWDLHDSTIGRDFPTDFNHSLGLPAWVNHMAFDAATLDELAARRTRWQEHGITVAEIDHGWCVSIYAMDPNGMMVEFCCTTTGLGPRDEEEAHRLLADENPPLEAPPVATIHHPVESPARA